MPYTYECLTKDMEEISRLENTEVFTIGKSEYGRELYAVKIGKGELNTIIIGTAHAREWINSLLVIEMVKLYTHAYNNYEFIENYNVRDVLDKCSIVFIPMQNPDGVTLQQQGLAAFTPRQQEEITQLGFNHKFKQWKANARGVDLNCQYNSGWEGFRRNEPFPCYQNHKGYMPEQAAEAKAIVEYIRKNSSNAKALISYHSSGQVIYWTSNNADIDRDKRLTKKVSDATRYMIINGDWTPGPGLCSWFRKETKGMALTIETGRYANGNEVDHSDWPMIWKQNKTVGLITATEVYNNWFNSNERQIRTEELTRSINQYKKEIVHTDQALNDIRELKEITASNEITMILENRIIQPENPLIIKNGLSYISSRDLNKLIDAGPTPGSSGANNIVADNEIYIPIRSLSDKYEIKWHADSRTILLRVKADISADQETPA